MSDTKFTVSDIDIAPTKVDGVTKKTYSREDVDKLLERVQILSDENETLRDENRSLRVRREAAEELNKLIAPYADRAFWYMCLYSASVGLLLAASGASFLGLSAFKLDSSVLEYLVGSTAVTVVGLVGMVLTGIFVGARK